MCKALFGKDVELQIDKKGFIRPFFYGQVDKDLIKTVCPLETLTGEYAHDIWGKHNGVYLGSSLDKDIRTQASSGGVITEILIYLLDSKKVDGVIHIGASKNDPLRNSTYLSITREQVLANSGSRYAPAAPLAEIDDFLMMDKKFAFVGKPCDVRALRNYGMMNSDVEKKIPYMLSFFCAGTPSYLATDEVVSKLGFSKREVSKFRYRGNGWPGYATATSTSGIEASMTYDDSWGGILGRQVQPYCRWCADGVGEFADVSCGDAWYLDDNNKPIFSESEGRNVIFARSSQGLELILEMASRGHLELSDFTKELKTLQAMQSYQHYRKATMLGKIIALKLLLRDAPRYQVKDLVLWSQRTKLRKNIQVFIGTLVRGLQRKF